VNTKKHGNTPPDNSTLPIPKVPRPAKGMLEPGEIAIPLVEEELVAKKQRVKGGEVIVRKSIETLPQSLPVDLTYDEVSVERVAINRVFEGTKPPQQRQEGDTLIIPVVEEQAVIVKRYVVREEIRITKRQATRREDLNGTVRREQIHIETSGNLEENAGQH
jgi:uncharacterized protein (TIGR02271 family)